jgi:hypothetical protein
MQTESRKCPFCNKITDHERITKQGVVPWELLKCLACNELSVYNTETGELNKYYLESYMTELLVKSARKERERAAKEVKQMKVI